MTFQFVPAKQFTERAGIFVALVGGTNAGKSWSGLRLARGIAGKSGKIAVLDTEGGRTLHLKRDFDFDANVMEAPFRPHLFSEAAEAAEKAGYDVLLIDSFSMEWAGVGGVLDWQAQELQRMAGDDYAKRERVKMAAWIKPKMAHKQMVYSLLQRRIPIIFSIRGEESVKPGGPGEKPTTIFKAVCNTAFPFEVTVSFRLASARKGIIDLSDPSAWKMEKAHAEIFRDGEQLSEEHGERLEAWARGAAADPPSPALQGALIGRSREEWKAWASNARKTAANATDVAVLDDLMADPDLAELRSVSADAHGAVVAAIANRRTHLQFETQGAK